MFFMMSIYARSGRLGLDATAGAGTPASENDRQAAVADSSDAMSEGTPATIMMIKRRARQAGFPAEICAHSFRGTGITESLRNGGDLEVVARIAGHESNRTTQLIYDDAMGYATPPVRRRRSNASSLGK